MGLEYPKDIKSFLAQLPTTHDDLRSLSQEFKYYLVCAEQRGDRAAADCILQTLSHITYRIFKFPNVTDDYALSFVAAYEHQLPLMKWNPNPLVEKIVPWSFLPDDRVDEYEAYISRKNQEDLDRFSERLCEGLQDEVVFEELSECCEVLPQCAVAKASVVTSVKNSVKVFKPKVERSSTGSNGLSPWLSKTSRRDTPQWLKRLYLVGYKFRDIALYNIRRKQPIKNLVSPQRWFKRHIRGPQYDNPKHVYIYIWLSLNELCPVTTMYSAPSNRFVRLVSALGNFVYSSSEVLFIGDGRSGRPPDLVNIAFDACVQAIGHSSLRQC